MKQNLTKNPVISRFFSVTGITGLIFLRECFLSLGLIILMVFKKSGLGLEKLVLVLT